MDPMQDGYYTNLLSEETNLGYDFSIETFPTSPQLESTTKKQRGGNFTADEDALIISAWLNISLDPVHGNEQKSKTYWHRVWEYFHQYKEFPSNRTEISLMNRWPAIHRATNKF